MRDERAPVLVGVGQWSERIEDPRETSSPIAILTEAAKLVDAGKLKIHVSKTFALEELAEAHRLQETGHVTGKLALRL